MFSFLKKVLNAAGSVLNQATFYAAVNAIGTGWRSTNGLPHVLSAWRHDGGNGYRYYVYDKASPCMKYTSGILAIE